MRETDYVLARLDKWEYDLYEKRYTHEVTQTFIGNITSQLKGTKTLDSLRRENILQII